MIFGLIWLHFFDFFFCSELDLGLDINLIDKTKKKNKTGCVHYQHMLFLLLAKYYHSYPQSKHKRVCIKVVVCR